MTPEAVLVQVDRLRASAGGWTPSRWAGPPRPLPGLSPTAASRSDIAYHLVEVIAELAAAAEGQPRRRVPRLEPDLVLLDQLRLVAHDLVAARPAPDLVQRALAELALHRAELDGAAPNDDVARGLGRSRRRAAVLAAAAARCPAR